MSPVQVEPAVYTRDSYRAILLEALSSGYAFRAFDDAAPAPGRVCLLRHDVDADLGPAAELAEIEHELEVRSTYFVMLRSPLYNALARANRRLVRSIVAHGHFLGLHYDLALAPVDTRDVEAAIRFEVDVLEHEFDSPVGAVSFHQPGANPLARELQPEGIVNAFEVPGFHYVADSNRSDDARSLGELFRSARHDRVQLLIHPIWWAGGPDATTEDLWDRAIVANLERSQEQLLETERAYGSPRSVRLERSDPGDHE